VSDFECKGPWRRIREHLSLPLEEYGEFHGTANEIAGRLRTSNPDLAETILAEAEKVAAEAFDRADGAERRATTLQGAIAIAASFGIAAGALLLDSNKIKSDGWRQTFAVISLGFVFCLVASGFRAVSAVYRVHRWSYPESSEIFKRSKMDAREAKTHRAAALLRTVSRNQSIARWKVAYMRAAAWWFRLALAFLLADALALAVYTFFGARIPHIHVPWTRSHDTDRFYGRYVPPAFTLGALVWFGFTRRLDRHRGSRTLGRKQWAMLGLLVLGLAVAAAIIWFVPPWRVHFVPLRNLGVVVGVLAAIWIGWTYRILGDRYSGDLAPAANYGLVTDGPYALVRHPSYLGRVVLSASPCMIWSAGFAAVSAVLLVVCYWAAHVEEQGLLVRDGTRYAAYRECVRDRILPFDRLFGTRA
jgi:protein-S-isoprenylcysteine O-methyltransferase Ste14